MDRLNIELSPECDPKNSPDAIIAHNSVWGKLETIQVLLLVTCIKKCLKLVEGLRLQVLRAQLVCCILVRPNIASSYIMTNLVQSYLTSIVKFLYFLGISILWYLGYLKVPTICHYQVPNCSNFNTSGNLLTTTNFCRMRISIGFENAASHSGWSLTASGFSSMINPPIYQWMCI